MSITLSIENAHLSFAETVIFTNLNFELEQGKWIALLGRSGVGKSSLLRAIAGLCPSCQVTLKGEKNITYLPQNDLLIPWKTVLDNVLLGSLVRGDYKKAMRERALALLSRVGLGESLRLYPRQLSGGMRQRVALVRTLIEDRPIVLMDEPFSALDAITRYQLQDLTSSLLKDKTVLFVTHDPLEALRLADKIYILHPHPRTLSHVLSLETRRPRAIAELAGEQQVLYDELSA